MKQDFTIQVEGHSVQLAVWDDSDFQPCGECQACCKTMAVLELDKPNYKRCSHQCGAGCAIYADRPKSCQTFNCGYRTGLVKDRPDRSGLIVDFSPYPLPGTFRIWECRPGASQTNRGKRIISGLKRKYSGYEFVVMTKELDRQLPKQLPHTLVQEMKSLGDKIGNALVQKIQASPRTSDAIQPAGETPPTSSDCPDSSGMQA